MVRQWTIYWSTVYQKIQTAVNKLVFQSTFSESLPIIQIINHVWFPLKKTPNVNYTKIPSCSHSNHYVHMHGLTFPSDDLCRHEIYGFYYSHDCDHLT